MAGLSTEYEGFFAEFYDVLQPDAPEAGAYRRMARGPVLELGCGTGRLLLPLVRAGIETDGIDLAEDMLARARAKLEAEPEEVRARARLHRVDMRDFRLDRPYGTVFASNNAVNHLMTPADLLACFRNVRAHLAPDGRFVVDNSAPVLSEMAERSGETEVLEFVHPERGTQLVSRFTPTFDLLLQIETDEIELSEYDGDRLVHRAETTVVSRFYLPAELRLGLVAAGFEIVEERGTLSGRPLAEGCPEIVLIARPA